VCPCTQENLKFFCFQKQLYSLIEKIFWLENLFVDCSVWMATFCYSSKIHPVKVMSLGWPFDNSNFIVMWKLQNACATQIAERVI